MRKITADIIYPVSDSPLTNHYLTIENNGKIISIDEIKGDEKLEKFQGAIIPGFINTHCHLELSHMKGKVNTGTGLIPFITNVVQQRASSEEEIQQAIFEAEKEMYDGGIVAVGDISNVTDTFAYKEKSRMRFYSFIEMFDFFQEKDADATFDKYQNVFNQLNLKEKDNKAIVPHAPYSVSEKLFERLKKETPASGKTISIHNQETPPENELFQTQTGDFVPWYKSFGLELNDFHSKGINSIDYALRFLHPENKTLFVHNSMSTETDIQKAQNWSKNTFWCTCPNANLYIENRLPNYNYFLKNKSKITIGTDSLTSNWQLSILEEMKIIAKYQSYVSFENLLEWATLNGAEALGFEQDLGSIEVGKTPGLTNLTHFKGQLHKDTDVKKIE